MTELGEAKKAKTEITLYYKNGDTRTIDRTPHGLKHPSDASRPYKIILNKEAGNDMHIYKACYMALCPKHREGVSVWLD